MRYDAYPLDLLKVLSFGICIRPRNLIILPGANCLALSINLSSKITGQSLIVKVTDQGIGIDRQDLPHIFERFYRSDKARTNQYVSGYGLGLSIAKKIIDAHHGAIQVTSKKNQGSAFTITLPLKQPRNIL